MMLFYIHDNLEPFYFITFSLEFLWHFQISTLVLYAISASVVAVTLSPTLTGLALFIKRRGFQDNT